MSFKKEYNTDVAKEVKEQRKILPYTVSDIGGAEQLKAWKAEQARKQAEWDAKAPERNAANFERSYEVLTGQRKHVDKNEEIYKQYLANQSARAKKIENAEFANKRAAHAEPKKSILDKCIDWFMNIAFEPKP